MLSKSMSQACAPTNCPTTRPEGPVALPVDVEVLVQVVAPAAVVLGTNPKSVAVMK